MRLLCGRASMQFSIHIDYLQQLMGWILVAGGFEKNGNTPSLQNRWKDGRTDD
jgi:hypothetical protein